MERGSRPQFTIRRLMVVVVVAAVASWIWVMISRMDAAGRIMLLEFVGVLIAWVLLVVSFAFVASLLGRGDPRR